MFPGWENDAETMDVNQNMWGYCQNVSVCESVNPETD